MLAIYPVTPARLRVILGRLIRFEKYDARKGEYVPCDAPKELCEAILSLGGEWNLPKLRAILASPTIDPATGRIIETGGYDRETGILLDLPHTAQWQGVPENPTPEQCKVAAETLWHPFRDFPFVTPVDRGGWLACLLTADCRPLLPTAPAFGLDATCAGTGKTLLAECAAIMAGGRYELMPPVGDDETETRKRLFAALRGGANTLITDNETRHVDSATLCAVLTTGELSDRVLGESNNVTVPTLALMILTGNNLTLVGDLSRRVIKITLDAGIERPWDRSFDLDPKEHVKTNRLHLVCSALTLLRGFHTAGAPRPKGGRMASFEMWSDFIRGCVCWVAKNGWLDVADPVKSIESNFDADPDTNKLRALLVVWNKHFGSAGGTVAKAIKAAEGAPDGDLFAAMDEIGGERGKLNSRRISRWIERHQGRIADGLKFVRGEVVRERITWHSESVGSVVNVDTAIPPARNVRGENDKYVKGEEKTDFSDTSDIPTCSECIRFSPSRVNPSGFGVCLSPPDAKHSSRMPNTPADGCGRFQWRGEKVVPLRQKEMSR